MAMERIHEVGMGSSMLPAGDGCLHRRGALACKPAPPIPRPRESLPPLANRHKSGAFGVICSDGLWGVLTEQDLTRAINDAPTLQRACQNLVNAANAAGGPDNISVILVQLIG